MALISQRNAKMFAKLGGAGTGSPIGESPDNQPIWEVPVLAGFSFGQTTNSTEVTVNEAGFNSRRARVLFNDSLAPVEFSFSTYIRPTSGTSPTRVVAPEAVLFAMLMGADSFSDTTGTFYSSTQAVYGSPTQSVSPGTSPTSLNAINTGSSNSTVDTFDFSASNVSFYPSGNSIIFQVQEGSNYEVFTIANAQMNEVTIDFDINGIATAQWSGMGTSITRSTSSITPTFNQGVTSTTNFIRNKLSTLKISSYASAGSPSVASPGALTDTYDIVLTGGNFTISNNMSFLMPEELGKVNQTIGNITGTRTISGSLTCYYDTAIGSSKSSELWQDLITGNSGGSPSNTTIPAIRNAHFMEISIGGTTGNRLLLSLPTAHLEIPTINPDELFTLEANFHAIPSQGNFDNTDEASISYGI